MMTTEETELSQTELVEVTDEMLRSVERVRASPNWTGAGSPEAELASVIAAMIPAPGAPRLAREGVVRRRESRSAKLEVVPWPTPLETSSYALEVARGALMRSSVRALGSETTVPRETSVRSSSPALESERVTPPRSAAETSVQRASSHALESERVVTTPRSAAETSVRRSSSHALESERVVMTPRSAGETSVRRSSSQSETAALPQPAPTAPSAPPKMDDPEVRRATLRQMPALEALPTREIPRVRRDDSLTAEELASIRKEKTFIHTFLALVAIAVLLAAWCLASSSVDPQFGGRKPVVRATK